MSQTFTIKPLDGWQVGDRAYCVRGSRKTTPSLEAGRVYRISRVIPVAGHVDCGVAVEGVSLPDNLPGMWSGRFVKLRPGRRAMREIDTMTTRVWIDAYKASVGQAPHPHSLTPSKG